MPKSNPRRSPRARRAPASRLPPVPAQPARWAALIYLAGDVDPDLAPAIARDLREILKTDVDSPDFRVAVQCDTPEGAFRHLLSDKNSRRARPVEALGRIDSASPAALADFLRWGFQTCPAERVGLVLRGTTLPSQPAFEDASLAETPAGARLFAICRDDSANTQLGASELGKVLRSVLGERQRDQIELLALDTGQTQFLELAYELEGMVHVLIAPQTVTPTEGWTYATVLGAWRDAVAESPRGLDTASLATRLLPAIAQSYSSRKSAPGVAISALDLRRLEDVARAFDTLCIGIMQSLGEGLIWQARAVLISLFDRTLAAGSRAAAPSRLDHAEAFAEWEEQPPAPASDAYDCGSLFALLGATFQTMADEACQGWIGTLLVRARHDRWKRFRLSVARELALAASSNPADAEALRALADLLQSETPRASGRELLESLNRRVRQRIALLRPDRYSRVEWDDACRAARRVDQTLHAAILSSAKLLPAERRVDYARLQQAIDTARRLGRQAERAAVILLGNSAADVADATSSLPENLARPGMVIAVAAAGQPSQGWPRWSGVSLYRPPRLDELMSASYQQFAFHQRIHWASLLGAANLIEQHPRALWRLVSSLLATGSAPARRDLLRRLTGADSVIWGLRDQFRAMAPAPTLTLSLERRVDVCLQIDPAQPSGNTLAAPTDTYLLRLESLSRGATVLEQESRVQTRLLDRALEELGALLAGDPATPAAFARLRAIGSLLGDDILQTLARPLEEERELALLEGCGATPHLQLQMPRALMRFPWELLHQRGEWLSERFAMGRQVFMETGLARRVTRRQSGRIAALVIGDPILDPGHPFEQLPGARAEAEQVAGLFDRLRHEAGDLIDFDRQRDTRIGVRLTTAEFRDLLREGRYDIIHFAGHGKFQRDDPETSAWLLSDGELWALEIRNTLLDHPAPPWLVYANACEAAMESAARSPVYQGNVFGLATAFINQGVAAYIGPLWPIDDLLAEHIALQFYRAVLSDRATLGEALRRAKRSARALLEPTTGSPVRAGLGWASLVLYGDPTEELFHALAGAPPETPDEVPERRTQLARKRNHRRGIREKPESGRNQGA